MIDLTVFRYLTSEVLDEFPSFFYKELNSGIIVEEYAKNSPYGDDLFIMGEYCVNNCGRMIKVYYGSFMRMYSWMDEVQIKDEIRKVIRHEFTHHFESLGGEKGLEIEDKKQIEEYLRRKYS